MEFEPTSIPDVVLIRPRLFGDARGHFFESWEERKFAAAGLELRFLQDNQNRCWMLRWTCGAAREPSAGA
jgi:dTDP-4-dehydrorhamnose 3,5-epimerase